MKTIWKYQLTDASNNISVPLGAKLLALDNQHDVPCLWFMVDDQSTKQERRFDIYGTGHRLPENPGDYVGTFQLHGGNLVFHVFEVMQP